MKTKNAFPQCGSITKFSKSDYKRHLKLSWHPDVSLRDKPCVEVRVLWHDVTFNQAGFVNVEIKRPTCAADIVYGMNRLKRRYGEYFGARTMRTLMSMKPTVRFLDTWVRSKNRRKR